MEYLTRKNASDTFFSLHMQKTGRTLNLLFVFFSYTLFEGESSRLGWLGIALNQRPVREA